MPLDHPEFSNLLTLSAAIGANPFLVQAAGGNSSLKHDGLLWVKASGTWLQNALTEDIMVPVEIEPLLTAMERDDPLAEKAQVFVPEDKNPRGLRPSIETTLHSALPQRVVLHVHCVNTIAIAVREDADLILAEKLEGFNWISVPYVKPGLTLSRTIQKARRNDTDVIVLGNHGLVVAAESVEEAGQLLAQVCRALEQPARVLEAGDLRVLERICEGSEYRIPEFPQAHGVAVDSVSCATAAGGSLYPDHVIFLGEGSIVAGEGESIADVSERVAATGRPEPASMLFPGLGIVMRKDSNPSQEAMARCVSDVTARIPEDASVRYLSEAQNNELLNWDAEKYRRKLSLGNAAS